MTFSTLSGNRLAGAGPPPPVVNEGSSTGVTFSTLTNPDSDGINYRLASMTANCTLVVTTEGTAQVMLISGGAGSGGSSPFGGGGAILDGSQLIPVGTHSVVIGAGAPASDTAGIGGATYIGSVVKLNTGIGGMSAGCSRAGNRPASLSLCYTSSITGNAVYYGLTKDSFSTDGAGNNVPRVNRGDGGGSGASTAGTGTSGVAYIRWRTN